MHDIAPWSGWTDDYLPAKDSKSPFYGFENNLMMYENKIYNYYIHPEWDSFGSQTLYLKILYTSYTLHAVIIELIGEWNDSIENDIMFLKRDLIDPLIEKGVSKFLFICENVLIYHGDDDSYYEEWYDDVKDIKGYICFINTLEHVSTEMKKCHLDYYAIFDKTVSDIEWRKHKPQHLISLIDSIVKQGKKYLD